MSERCGWTGLEPIYIDYHDTEWGVPEWDSRALWEKLILDGFQAGLSWITILKKRENFRAAFEGFDPAVIATWGEDDVVRLLQNEGIIRHRGKIQATIGNAQAYLQIEDFSSYCWGWVGGAPMQTNFKTLDDVPPSTELSLAFSKDLKKRGFKFCGPTIVYAWMEACGLVNDHLTTCPQHSTCAALTTASARPRPQP
ncbi:DNA-3-methyladenine glycosylase I [Octadecabacter sp.]|jgi:DNA-3-methyladenine glycosylase I|nr:DNA-3-methyladenine glycosylase I [bacterium]MDB0062152.1 DNA-3-methyladenine glycosylase I [Octadecabacter sp.]MDC0011666.1 DNA-3-methyladenine glycosylase I [Octadecabacter sp.]MDC1380879.1 DNA-3-methyladenine glycosylase I [Octadecabacter sp.]MDC1499740.1 DNA-3-methyladenine glycosylase I [Octadecabacter sp.]|tara:strand:- start:8251 stop:8841 length:591 start_codon:yes stop_codon:yes gene_type:complete